MTLSSVLSECLVLILHRNMLVVDAPPAKPE